MLEVALRATLILAAAWALARLLRRATPATRHLVWHCALIASLLTPFASLAQMPQVLVIQVPQALHLPQVRQADVTTRTTVEAASGDTRGSGDTGEPSGILGTVSTLGTLAVALWFAIGWRASAQLARAAAPAPAAWQLEVNALCERLRIPREVRLGIIDRDTSPLATGLFRAAILLPRTAAAWTPDRRRAVILHELAHVKRRDCRVLLVTQAACALYWFHPMVWLAASQLRRERERACDDEVLRCGAQASSYATHLLDIARELRPALRPSAALAMARPSELEGRLLAVLATGRARVPARGTRWAIVTLLSLTTVVALSATTVTQKAALSAAPEPLRYTVTNDMMSAESKPIQASSAEATVDEAADPQERERATLALAFTSGRDVIPALLKALRDPDGQVREKAAIGLALRRDERVVQPLLDAMRDPDSQVREKVAIALGTSGDVRAQDALTRALDDPDAQVREKAVAGLVLLGIRR
jgi:beta-lactamase regulating signal transducer with metallopeptidase domain